MTNPAIGGRTLARTPWAMNPNEVNHVTYRFSRDPGTITAAAGVDDAVTATVTGTGRYRTITWAAEVCNSDPAVPETEDDDAIPAGIIGGNWRLYRNGIKRGEGLASVRKATDSPSVDVYDFQLVTEEAIIDVTIVGETDPATPVLDSADWWHRAGPHSTVLVDRGPRREHGVFAVQPPPIPVGTYLLASIAGVQTTRPSVPHHARLAFASGVRIIARGSLGIADGWKPLTEGHGFGDWFFHQSLGTDGIKDALEVGIYRDGDDRMGFVDSTPAGADPSGGDQQDYTDNLTVAQYFGVTAHLVEIDFPGGTQRRCRWYLPDPEGSKLTPGEVVEAWTLFDTVTRTAGPGFYINPALRWVLGDQPALYESVRLFDLATGDLALDFQASEATDAGWTDSAGNPWSCSVPLQVVTSTDGIVLPAATIPATAADPGAGSWSMAFHGIIDPARYVAGQASLVGTTTDIQSDPGWMFAFAPPEYGGVLFAVGDGTDYAAVQTGIEDCDKHTVVATVDRTTDLLYVSVDGVELTPADISAVGTITGDDLATVYGTVIDDFALYGRALTLAERAAVSAELTT